MSGERRGELVESPATREVEPLARITENGGRISRWRWRSRRVPPRMAIASVAAAIFGLSGLAVAVPLLTTLGDASTFFTAHRAGRAEVLLFTALFVLGPAAAVLALALVARVLTPRRADGVAHVLIGVLASAVVVPIVDRAADLSTTAYAIAASAVVVLVAIAHARREHVRRFMRLTAVGPFLVVAWFLLFSSVSGLVLPQATAGVARARNRSNVLFVIFDELPTVALMDSGREINARRFPGFARLAADAMWYRKTTTVAPWTHLAVPAIFSGKMPTAKPTSETYARNIFSMLEPTHDLVPLELVTHLCDTRACGRAPAEMDRLVDDSLIVYSHGLLPDDAAEKLLPTVDDRWKGFRGTGNDRPIITKGNKPDESRRFTRFARSIRTTSSDRPAAWVAHFRVPHLPLSYLPDGRHYDARRPPALVRGIEWGAEQAAIDVARQRYLLQVRYVDRLLAQLLDAVEQTGRYDDTMIVITSDHGVAFRPGHRRGVPSSVATAGDVVRVPLFVKYPGQTFGAIDDRSVQVYDILPTIAEALDVSLPKEWRFDGRSLLAEDAPPRGTTSYIERKGLRRDLPPIVDTKRGIRGYTRLFGEWRGAHDTYAWGPHWRLVGSDADDLEGERSSTVASLVMPQTMSYDAGDELTPALVELALDRPASHEWIAIAVNGRVAGLGRAFVDRGRDRAMAMIDPALLRDGHNDLDAFFVRPSGTLEEIYIRGEP